MYIQINMTTDYTVPLLEQLINEEYWWTYGWHTHLQFDFFGWGQTLRYALIKHNHWVYLIKSIKQIVMESIGVFLALQVILKKAKFEVFMTTKTARIAFKYNCVWMIVHVSQREYIVQSISKTVKWIQPSLPGDLSGTSVLP